MNDDMKAKNLIQGINEAEGEETFGGTPPGSTAQPQRPVRRPGERPGGPEGEEGPPGFFTPRELSQLKDIIILSLAGLMRSEEDTRIGMALAAGKELDSGHLQHILDEARRLKLPDSHKPILQKIYTKLTAAH